LAEITKNYGLKCPSDTDYYNIEDHNGNMRIIDDAIASAVNVGMYVGDGETERFISLPRTPKFVLILQNGNKLRENGNTTKVYGGLAVGDQPAFAADAYIIIEEGGFRLRHLNGAGSNSSVYVQINTTDSNYFYLWG